VAEWVTISQQLPDMQEYANKPEVQTLLQQLASDLFTERPEDALAYIGWVRAGYRAQGSKQDRLLALHAGPTFRTLHNIQDPPQSRVSSVIQTCAQQHAVYALVAAAAGNGSRRHRHSRQ
jgi:hypothetical protein